MALLLAGTAFAEGMSSTNKYAWSENAGWINFRPGSGNVVVTGTGMTGYAWNDVYGWINLAPAHGGVLNDGNGTLSGNAWGEQTGWINFSGVTIGSDGMFHGTASGTTVGRISFNCANNNTCGSSNFKVQTLWTPPSSSSSSSSSSSAASSAPAVSQSHGGGGARHVSVSADRTVANTSAASSSKPTISAPAAVIVPRVSVQVQMRTCARVQKGFTGSALKRVVARIMKVLGFRC